MNVPPELGLGASRLDRRRGGHLDRSLRRCKLREFCADARAVGHIIADLRATPLDFFGVMTTPATSKDIIEAFIGLIESHPCIYQYESQDQKDRTQIGLAWRDIMTSLEEAFARDDLIAVKLDSIKELKAKYHNLRYCKSEVQRNFII